jgi:ABC-type nitrate/sulfonate/bicarbonate transport system substrate-binding protein
MAAKSFAAALAAIGAIALGASLMARAAPSAAPPLKDVHVIVPQNSINVLVYMGGRDAGIFRRHGVNLTVDARPFAGFLAGLPSKQSMVGNYPGLEAIAKINQGLPWVIVGSGLTLMNGIVVRKDSPFKSVADLRGKRFGTHSTGAGSFKAIGALVRDAYHFDLAKDTKLEQMAAPALYKLLEAGQVDAMIGISSFTVKALSQPDKFRLLFSPNDYWIKQTGHPIGWDAPLVAWKSWVEQDPARARGFVDGAEESFRWLRDPHNFDTAVKKYGKLAGVTTPAQIAFYKKWLAAKKIFLTYWNRNIVASQWKFLQLAKSQGILKKVPPQAQYAMLVGKGS